MNIITWIERRAHTHTWRRARRRGKSAKNCTAKSVSAKTAVCVGSRDASTADALIAAFIDSTLVSLHPHQISTTTTRRHDAEPAPFLCAVVGEESIEREENGGKGPDGVR